ncbi:uncharacterized protein LOC114543743 [Dendronephthya gigantea]|uniref:uncharacterized protein LOC114543743 n=1 Tax=Dendronephthya gigantea TaxID=151771 RepID=UPI00106B85AD|nr:uncharacterized protein LOC114543743 [Dendronephthya gigantea]XP_028418404.1 uncharacterized protein LOC114543743 [Dendronephthya gigantea]
MPCVGQNISSEDEKQFLKLEVGGSKLVAVTSDDSNNQQNLISTSCLLMRLRTKSCKNCLYTEKLFRTRSSKRKASSISADHAPPQKCNLRFLDEKGLLKKVAEQNKQLKSSLKRETRIKEAELIELVDEDNQDLMEIVRSTKINDIPPNLKTLWEQQMKQLSMKSPTGYRWDPRIIRFVLDIYCKTPRALDAMREFLVLPSNRLIRYYKNAVNQDEGWNDEMISWCKKEAERQNLKPADYWGGLIMDEMKIQEDLQMTVKGGKHQLTGVVSLGNFYNSMKKIESQDDSKISLATHLLQFVFLSDCGFRFPIAHFPTAQCPSSVLYLKFWEGVLQMRRAGFVIYFSICDGGDPNRQFIKMHFPNCHPCDLHFVGYNMLTEDPIIFQMDCKHNFKKLRNNVEKSSERGTSRCLAKDGKNIFWSHWKQAFSWDQNSNSCHLHEKLKEDHFMLTPNSRMRNNLAEDVLDNKMLLLMKAYRDHLEKNEGEESSKRLDETIKFLSHTSVIVELFSDKHVIYHVQDRRIVKMQEALQYFRNWKSTISTSKQFLSEKLWFDLQSMILGFVSMVKSKLSRYPGSVVKPAIYNQDVVENHFCQLRGANGQNDNPTYQMIQCTQNSIIFGQTTLSKKCNTGSARNNSFSGLPKESLFSRNK